MAESNRAIWIIAAVLLGLVLLVDQCDGPEAESPASAPTPASVPAADLSALNAKLATVASDPRWARVHLVSTERNAYRVYLEYAVS